MSHTDSMYPLQSEYNCSLAERVKSRKRCSAEGSSLLSFLDHQNKYGKLPIFHVDLQQQSFNEDEGTSLFKLIESHEQNELCYAAGAFVLRLENFNGMKQAELERMVEESVLWSKQSLNPEIIEGTNLQTNIILYF